MPAEDNVAIIRNELAKFRGPQKTAGEYRMVMCPFHGDGDPSCGVFMRRDHPTKPLGWFHCFGCKAHGEWNVFAEKTGLQTIKEWNSKETNVEYDADKVEDALLGESGMTMRGVQRIMGCPEAQPWPEGMDWRGVSGKLISAVGGKVINDERADGIAVLFPIKIGRKIRGGVKAIFNKKTPSALGYITMNGEWVKQYGLFPYAYTAKLIRENGFTFVILVEGPRDALRLLKMGLPALAMLGASAVSRAKMLYITSLGVDQVYVMPDNDNGGRTLWRNIKQRVPSARRIKLPREKDENGKIIKMDPFSAPAPILKEVRLLMRDRHGWKRPTQET